MRVFRDMLALRRRAGMNLCVGLDPDPAKMPASAWSPDAIEESLVKFCIAIVMSVASVAACFKLNSAFFERFGDVGWRAMIRVIVYIRDNFPGVPIIWDAKRGDIGNTNSGYASAAFAWLMADAITVNPYFGGKSLSPFLDNASKMVFVLCRTTGAGSEEFQDLLVGDGDERAPLYLHIARAFTQRWNEKRNIGLVVGATSPAELKLVRDEAPESTILIPGVGTQGGSLIESVRAALDPSGSPNFVVNVSREISYASSGDDYTVAAGRKALEYHTNIRQAIETSRTPDPCAA